MEDNKPDFQTLGHEYVHNHTDSEVRRMYGHYLRTYKDGMERIWQDHVLPLQKDKRELIESFRDIQRNLVKAPRHESTDRAFQIIEEIISKHTK